MLREEYAEKLRELQTELCLMQFWMKQEQKRAVVVFEGRDAAGKGGCIRAMTERLNPRYCRVVALQKPTEREQSELYLQRYIRHLPAAGELVIYDRSWYNRAVVEYVMEFYGTKIACENRRRFFEYCSQFERELVKDGIFLVKFWLDVSFDEQQRRIERRIDDAMRLWKLSPIDIRSSRLWNEYSMALNEMLYYTSSDEPGLRWSFIDSDDKLTARLNCITHLLSEIPYEYVEKPVSNDLLFDIQAYRYLKLDRPVSIDKNIRRPPIEGVLEVAKDLYLNFESKFPDAVEVPTEDQGREARFKAFAEDSLSSISNEPDCAAKADSIAKIAILYVKNGELETAEKQFRESVDMLDRLGMDMSKEVAELLPFLASSCFGLGNTAEAEQLFKRAMNIVEAASGKENRQFADLLASLGSVYAADRNFVRAEQVLAESVNLFEKVDQSDERYPTALQSLGDVYWSQENWQAAEEVYQKLLNVLQRIAGSDHISLHQVKMGLASTCIHLERDAEAAGLMEQCIFTIERTYGHVHPKLAETLDDYSFLLELMGQEDASKDAKKRAGEILSQIEQEHS